MKKTVLITGASGLIGTALTDLLVTEGYQVYHLSRSKIGANPKAKVFLWDVYAGTIDENCINGVDTIVHLAGEGIADKLWTKKRKEQIIESRVRSIDLIYNLLKTNPHQVKTLISASGINYYQDDPDKLRTESDPAGKGFLSEVCVEWEEAANAGKELGLRVVLFRTGIVLDKNRGALPKIALPVRYGLGAALGTGEQWVSWIHIKDAARTYLFALENEINGPFNMAAPQPVSNKVLTKLVAQTLKKPFWMPAVPAFLLKMVLGKMSSTVLSSVKASGTKIQEAGFEFQFPTLQSALSDLYKK